MPRDPQRRALVAAGVLLAVVALAFLTQMLPRIERQQAASAGTPVPFGSRAQADLVLAAGATACEPRIAIDDDAATATIATRPSSGRATAPLELTLSGSGYRASATVPGGTTDAAARTVPIDPPPHALIGTACLRNVGTRPVVVSGSGDPRVLTRTRASVDGTERAAAFILTFQEQGRRGVLASVPDLIDRAATFSAVGPWLYWLLLPLLVLGVPLAVAGALLVALRSPDAADPDER